MSDTVNDNVLDDDDDDDLDVVDGDEADDVDDEPIDVPDDTDGDNIEEEEEEKKVKDPMFKRIRAMRVVYKRAKQIFDERLEFDAITTSVSITRKGYDVRIGYRRDPEQIALNNFRYFVAIDLSKQFIWFQ